MKTIRTSTIRYVFNSIRKSRATNAKLISLLNLQIYTNVIARYSIQFAKYFFILTLIGF